MINRVLSLFLLVVSFFPCFAYSFEYRKPTEIPKENQLFMYVSINACLPKYMRQTIIISHFREEIHLKDIKKVGWYSLELKDLPNIFKFNIPIVYFP